MGMSAPWAESAGTLLRSLETDQDSGLPVQRVQSIQAKYGKNVLSDDKGVSPLKIVLRQINNPMVYILLIATVGAAVLGEVINAVAIVAIVILNVIIGFVQDYKAEEAISALKKLTVPKARVIRDGNVHTIEAEDVVPGDILHLEAGDYVVADARVIQAFQLSADESVLTGESLPVEKYVEPIGEEVLLADRKNMLSAGTAISTGSGRAVVTAIGMKTEIGRIAGLLRDTSDQATPLQKRLEKVGHKLLVIGLVVVIAVFALGIYHGLDRFTILMSAISLAVAAIPEGLPTVVSLALALAVRRMTKRNALVRKMAAVETLGSIDIICTDKTGTLTTGKMRVREVVTASNEEFLHALVLCNNASLHGEGSGDPTEIALLLQARDQGVDVPEMRRKNPRIHEWSFDSQRKRMTVAIGADEDVLLYSKGAPDALIPLCRLSNEELAKLEQKTLELSSLGRRVLAVATKKMSGRDLAKKGHEEVEKDLVFLGLVAMADPPKEETLSSIKQCKAAGIRVVMITGDHPATAKAIGTELGIIDENFSDVMTGLDLNSLPDDEIRKRVERTAVYARVTPEHKLKIIGALEANGHLVSMTGDGVNDAPALKKAAIGVAMGKAGTEVARQASAIILTDDNFSTIVSAIEEGRAIFGNIKRTVQYLLSTNLAEILVVLGASVMSLPIPFAPISLLWINLVTDGFPSLALAAEPVEKDFFRFSKTPSPKSFFDRHFMRELFFVGASMTALVLGVYVYALRYSDTITAQSYAFNLMVFMTLFRSFSCRSETRTFLELPFNRWHMASVIFPIGLQLLLQRFELFRKLLQVRSLTLQEGLILLGIGLIPLSIVELMKLIRRKRSI